MGQVWPWLIQVIRAFAKAGPDPAIRQKFVRALWWLYHDVRQ